MNDDATNGELSFEDAFKRLDEVVHEMEAGSSSLDRAIGLYEEGMRLSKYCEKMLENAELRVKKLREDLADDDAGIELRDDPVSSDYLADSDSDASSDDQTNLPW